jgi:hypothetical protein
MRKKLKQEEVDYGNLIYTARKMLARNATNRRQEHSKSRQDSSPIAAKQTIREGGKQNKERSKKQTM